MEKNMFSWVEIAVNNFSRAKAFYETILDVKIEEMEFGGFQMGFFPGFDGQGVSGAIVKGEDYEASDKGAVVYFNANPDLQPFLERVEKAGGKIIQQKKQISPEYGYMALLMDTEGNRVALHSYE